MFSTVSRAIAHFFPFCDVPVQFLGARLSFFNKFIYLFYFSLCWVFVAACGLSLVAASGGYSSLQCAGFSLRWLLLLQSMDSRHAGFSSCGTQALEGMGSVVVARGLSCFAACEIFPDQGSNTCPLPWQADS